MTFVHNQSRRYDCAAVSFTSRRCRIDLSACEHRGVLYKPERCREHKKKKRKKRDAEKSALQHYQPVRKHDLAFRHLMTMVNILTTPLMSYCKIFSATLVYNKYLTIWRITNEPNNKFYWTLNVDPQALAEISHNSPTLGDIIHNLAKTSLHVSLD